jgi:hypothetical protein
MDVRRSLEGADTGRAGADALPSTHRPACCGSHPPGVSHVTLCHDTETKRVRQSDRVTGGLVPNYSCPWHWDSGTRVAKCPPVVSPQSRNRRQHPRTRVTWPVVIETRRQRYPCQVVDISNHGAKVMTSARLRTGSVVRLQIIPPDGTPLRVGALVWRLDPDGVAFFFARSIHHRFIRAA